MKFIVSSVVCLSKIMYGAFLACYLLVKLGFVLPYAVKTTCPVILM